MHQLLHGMHTLIDIRSLPTFDVSDSGDMLSFVRAILLQESGPRLVKSILESVILAGFLSSRS